MKLSQMQDIGGCRAVVQSVAHVEKLVDTYIKSDLKQSLLTQMTILRSLESQDIVGYI
jgi:hypothetical protein